MSLGHKGKNLESMNIRYEFISQLRKKKLQGTKEKNIHNNKNNSKHILSSSWVLSTVVLPTILSVLYSISFIPFNNPTI